MQNRNLITVIFVGLLTTTFIMVQSTWSIAQENAPQAMEGGKGTINTPSASINGKGYLGFNVHALYTNSNLGGLTGREHIFIEATSVSYALSDEVELSSVLYALGQGRLYSETGPPDDFASGLGLAKIAAKYHFPFPSEDYDIGSKLSLFVPLESNFTLHPSYPYDIDQYGIELMALQSFKVGKKSILHLNEGYRWQGLRGDEVSKDDLVKTAIAYEYRLNPKWIAFSELTSVLELDDKVELLRDRLLITPGLQHFTPWGFTLNFGLNIGLSKKRKDGMIKRAEAWRVLVGISFGTSTFHPDDDGDGVPNIADLDPHTPNGWPVDSKGRPLDSDGDGIPDGIDQEIHTIKGALVDIHGRAFDTDGDGVPDGIDQETNTPNGAEVNVKGVAIDSDVDGVPNGIDLEPNTAPGAIVDSKGRAMIPMEVELLTKGLLRVYKIYFDVGKATIKPESYAILNEIGRILQKYPDLKIQICGHTDAQGTDEFNMQLSNDRALNVKDYLLTRFMDIKEDNLTVKGFGRSQPLIDNRTEEGRARNRRVEFIVLNLDQLKEDENR